MPLPNKFITKNELKRIIKRDLKEAKLTDLKNLFNNYYHCFGLHKDSCRASDGWCPNCRFELSNSNTEPNLSNHAGKYISLIREYCPSSFVSKLPPKRRLMVMRAILGEKAQQEDENDKK